MCLPQVFFLFLTKFEIYLSVPPNCSRMKKCGFVTFCKSCCSFFKLLLSSSVIETATREEPWKKFWKWTFIYKLVGRLISRTAIDNYEKIVIRHFLFVRSWGGHEISSASWMLRNALFSGDSKNSISIKHSCDM